MKNKETLEEVDENKKNLYYRKQVMNPYPVEGHSYTAYEKGFIDGYHESTKWQQEQNKNLYSEEEIMGMFDNLKMHLPLHYEMLVKEMFKKK